jgi:hypothetical protein
MNEQKKYEIIKKLKESNGDKRRAAVELGCTLRHVNRMLKGYAQQGKQFFSHGNKGRKPAIALSDELRNEILFLYQNKYDTCNFQHFTELLAKHDGIHISAGTARNILMESDILSPMAWKRTRRAQIKKLKEKQAETESPRKKEALQVAIVAAQDAHPTRSRCAYAGEMVQMDASLHLWFGETKTQLHAAIDDATGIVVGAYFDHQETLNGYYHVFHQILTTYGIPYMFYTDRRTVFEYKKKSSPELENDTFTQFAYACKQLGVELKTTSIPQAKGRVERLFKTLQSRLPIEMRLAGIQTIEQANEFLHNYIKEFNAQFALPYHTTTSVFEAQPSVDKINQILAVLSPRVIDAGHSVRFKNHRYRLLDENGLGEFPYKGTKALVVQTFSGDLFCNVGERLYVLEEIPMHEKTSLNFNTEKEINEARKPKKQNIPPMNHPWRKDNFMKYVMMMSGNEVAWAV